MTNGAVDASLAWDAPIGFGVDRTDGPYVIPPTDSSPLTVTLAASLAAGTQLTATLGLLAVTATQPASGAGQTIVTIRLRSRSRRSLP